MTTPLALKVLVVLVLLKIMVLLLVLMELPCQTFRVSRLTSGKDLSGTLLVSLCSTCGLSALVSRYFFFLWFRLSFIVLVFVDMSYVDSWGFSYSHFYIIILC